MHDSDNAPSVAPWTQGEGPSAPLESFISAAQVALAEMAGTEVAVQEVYQATLDNLWGDVCAIVSIKSATEGLFILSFPEKTAAALAERVLADAKAAITENLIQDCVGEVANVIAGQAKTLLTGSPHQFTFSLPRVVSGNVSQSHSEPSRGCLVAVFQSDLGEFRLHLSVEG